MRSPGSIRPRMSPALTSAPGLRLKSFRSRRPALSLLSSTTYSGLTVTLPGRASIASEDMTGSTRANGRSDRKTTIAATATPAQAVAICRTTRKLRFGAGIACGELVHCGIGGDHRQKIAPGRQESVPRGSVADLGGAVRVLAAVGVVLGDVAELELGLLLQVAVGGHFELPFGDLELAPGEIDAALRILGFVHDLIGGLVQLAFGLAPPEQGLVRPSAGSEPVEDVPVRAQGILLRRQRGLRHCSVLHVALVPLLDRGAGREAGIKADARNLVLQPGLLELQFALLDLDRVPRASLEQFGDQA